MNEILRHIVHKLRNGQMPTPLELSQLEHAWERVKQLLPPVSSNLLKEHL